MPNGVLVTSGSQVSVINTALGEREIEKESQIDGQTDKERKRGMEREHRLDLSCSTSHK